MPKSLIDILKQHIFDIYPKEMSSVEVERFAREHSYLGETGRKRMADLREDGFVNTREETVKKKDGKTIKVAFHQAIPDRANEIYQPKYEYVYDEEKQVMVEKRIDTVPKALKLKELNLDI